MIRMKDFTLSEIQAAIDSSVEELDDGFRSSLNRDGCELTLSYPKRLQLRPGKINSPYSSSPDLEGKLLGVFGAEYDACAASFIPGQYNTACDQDGDHPDFRIAYGFDTATHLLIFIDWPTGHPPVDAGPESETYKRLNANFFFRTEDVDAPHGEDLWVIPLEAIEEIRPYLADLDRHYTLGHDEEWRQFDVEKPFYRQKIKDVTERLKAYRIDFIFGDDYLTAVVADEARDVIGTALDQPIWYNSEGTQRMEMISFRLNRGGMSSALGGVLAAAILSGLGS